MIVVTGTKRSGTSMWMQMLQAAGFPVVGDAFPHAWKNTIADANPRGFWESPWRKGINWQTNPDPNTGVYVPAAVVARHAVKIFPPGVVRTEREYLGSVIVCVRNWREYSRSISRLYEMERAGKERLRGEPVPMRRTIPPVLEWWDENFALVRDIATRQYRARFVSYNAVLTSPEERVADLIGWVGGGDHRAAIAAIEPQLRTQQMAASFDAAADGECGLDVAQIAVLDAFYQTVDLSQPFSPVLLDAMNQLHRELAPRIAEARARLSAGHSRRQRYIARIRRSAS